MTGSRAYGQVSSVALSGLFDTGVNSSGVALAASSVDPHYTLTSTADATDFPTPNTYVIPSPPAPPWLANTTASAWIGPNNAGGSAAAGNYTYQTTFTIPNGVGPSGVQVSGNWATDNAGTNIIVNGVSTGQMNSAEFVSYTGFTINSGFQTGLNTIQFMVNNGTPSNNPTGLRVDGISGSAARPITGLFSTGLDATGNALSSGAADPHYQVVTSTDPSFPAPRQAVVVSTTAFPVTGPWLADSSASEWISLQSGNSAEAQPGTYDYRTTFNLTNYELNTVVIKGLWAADDGGTNVLLNGVSEGLTTSGGFSSFSSFTLTSGFTSGLNTLDFIVVNGTSSANPTGLNVQLTSSATYVPAPDSAIIFFGVSLTFVNVVRRRIRSRASARDTV